MNLDSRTFPLRAVVSKDPRNGDFVLECGHTTMQSAHTRQDRRQEYRIVEPKRIRCFDCANPEVK